MLTCCSHVHIRARKRDRYTAAGRPAQERQEFGEDHRRRAPDFLAPDMKRRNDAAPRRRASRSTRTAMIGVDQIVRRQVRECARPRRLMASAPGARWSTPTIGCRRNPLTGMSIGVSAPSTRLASTRQRDLFVRFAQRGLLERFAGLDDAARQRHLPAVPPERVRANSEHDVCACLVGKHQQESGRVAYARGVEAGRPVAPRDGREACLRCGAGQLAGETLLESATTSANRITSPALPRRTRGTSNTEDTVLPCLIPCPQFVSVNSVVLPCQGTIVIAEQLLCGAGYDARW